MLRKLPQENRYGGENGRRKWYGRMENGGIYIYARITRTHAHVFIAFSLSGIGRRVRNASLALCFGAADIPMAKLVQSLKLCA